MQSKVVQDDKMKQSIGFVGRVQKPEDKDSKNQEGKKEDWGFATSKEESKPAVRQINMNAIAKPSKPFNNSGDYGKSQGRGYNEGRQRNKRYD